MTKFLKRTCLVLALLLCCTFVFVGCGEDEEEVPHHLEVKAACYVDGVKDDTWVLTNHNALKGSGDYAEQDRVNLEAPIEHYYQFIGWYDDSGEYIEPASTHSFWWNMEYDRDGYVEARYVPLEYDIVFLNEKTGSTPVKAHYNCVTEMLQYEGQAAQKVDSLPKPTHVEHYKNEKWLYYNNLEKVCPDFPINEEDEGLMPLVSGQPELELTLQAEYEDEYYALPTITVKDTDGNTITLKDEDLNITLKDSAGTPITEPVDSYKYGTTISVRVNAIIGYKLDGIYVNDAKHTNNYLENHILEENDKIEIILKAELWNVYFDFNKDLIPSSFGDVCSDMTISGVSTYVDDVLASSATTLTESSTVKANYNTSFTVRFKLQSNLSFDKLTIGEDEITPTQNGEYYEFTYTVAGQYYPVIYLYVVAE